MKNVKKHCLLAILCLLLLTCLLVLMPSCNDAKDNANNDTDIVDALMGRIDNLTKNGKVITLNDEDTVNDLLRIYNNLSADDQAKITNYSKLETAKNKIYQLNTIGEKAIVFDNTLEMMTDETYTPSIVTTDLAVDGQMPTITFSVVDSNNEAKATIKDGVITAESLGVFEVSVRVYYAEKNVEIVESKEVNVKGYKCTANVIIPEGNSGRLASVRVSCGNIAFTYDSETQKFVGELPLKDNVTLTASLDGFSDTKNTINVAKNNDNTIDLTFTDMLYGPKGIKVGAGISGTWTYNEEEKSINFLRGNSEDTSMFSAANGLKTTNVLISADIEMGVGTVHRSSEEGSGIMFSVSGVGNLGILMKPGQGTFCLINGSAQNITAFYGSGIDLGITKSMVSVYNGASTNAKGRINVPTSIYGVSGDSYTTKTVNIKVIRLNTQIFVLLNDTLYASFIIPEIDGVPGSVGFCNANHDTIKITNFSVVTDTSALIAPVADRFYLVNSVVEEGCDDVSIVVTGDVSGRVMAGSSITATISSTSSARTVYTKITNATYTCSLDENGNQVFVITPNGEGKITISAKSLTSKNTRDWTITPTIDNNIKLSGTTPSDAYGYITTQDGYTTALKNVDGNLVAKAQTNTVLTAHISHPSYQDVEITKEFATKAETGTATFCAFSLSEIHRYNGQEMYWEYNSANNSYYMCRNATKSVSTNEGSYIYLAEGFTSNRFMLSMNLNLSMGKYHSVAEEGAGVIFYSDSSTNLGIMLKPGQNLFCFSEITMSKGATQDLVGLGGASFYTTIIETKDATLSGGATWTTNNKGRIVVPALDASYNLTDYSIDVKLTIIRDEDMVYVLFNDTLCATFHVSAIGDVAGGIGLFNVNHDEMTCTNLVITEDIDAKLCEIGVHEWDDGVVTKEPTVDAVGEKTVTCIHCHTTSVLEIAKLKTPAVDTEIYFNCGATSVYVNGTRTYLYDLPANFNYGDVVVKLKNVDTEIVNTIVLTGPETVINGKTGNYLVTYSYNNNLWSEYITITQTNNRIYGGVSNTRLGGTVQIKKQTGDDFSLQSFGTVDTLATSGSNWALSNGYYNCARMTSYTYTLQNEVYENNIYVEGKFDVANQTFGGNIGACSAGLLVAHGADNLSGTNTYSYKLIIGLRGTSVIATETGTGWDSLNSNIIVNLDGLKDSNGNTIVDDWTSVKLGVLRKGTNYFVYVNDVYVGNYVYTQITAKSSVGLAACNTVNVTVSEFNYSTNPTLLSALEVTVQTKDIDIYLIAGQSNASGNTSFAQGTMESLNSKYVYGFNNIYYMGNSGVNWKNNTSLGLVRTGLGETASLMGPEVGLAETLSEYYNTETGKYAGIIRYAVGGTCLLDVAGDSTSGNKADGNWASPSQISANGGAKLGSLSGGLYNNFFTELDKALAQYRAMGFNPIIKGLYWMQGENDKNSPEAYATAFAQFVTDIRADLTTHTQQDCSNLPILVGEICRTSASGVSTSTTVNYAFIAMQDNLVNSISNCYVIKNSTYDIHTIGTATRITGCDDYHWNAQDHIYIGNHIGECILYNILNDKTASTTWWITKN